MQFAVYMVGAIATVWIIVCAICRADGIELVGIRPRDRPLATVRLRSVAHQTEHHVLVRAASAARFCRWPRTASIR